MARPDDIPSDVVEFVARQIGEQIPRVAPEELLRGASVELNESLAVWCLGGDRIATGLDRNADFEGLVTPTGRWHHQLKFDGKPAMFGRSTPLGPDAESWQLRELFVSPISEKIDRAISWVDENVSEDCVVRLLIVPAYHIHALWLKFEDGEGRVLVADSPEQLTGIDVMRLYASYEFLEALTQEQHISGIAR